MSDGRRQTESLVGYGQYSPIMGLRRQDAYSEKVLTENYFSLEGHPF